MICLQIINVYNQQYESVAAFWPHVHSRIIASLLISQLLLMGLLSTKEAASSTPLLVVLPVFTLAFHKYCKRRFEPAFRNHPLEVIPQCPLLVISDDSLKRTPSIIFSSPGIYVNGEVLIFFVSFLHHYFPLQEAMAKDLAERQEEPNLNLKAYLADAYLHPIFRSFEVEEEEVVQVGADKHRSHVASPSGSELSSPSPIHHAYHYEVNTQNYYSYHYEAEP